MQAAMAIDGISQDTWLGSGLPRAGHASVTEALCASKAELTGLLEQLTDLQRQSQEHLQYFAMQGKVDVRSLTLAATGRLGM